MYCPPLPLLWGFRPGDGTAASVVHQAYAREFWRERGFTGRLGLLTQFLTWPLMVFGTLVWFTALNGREIRRRSGKSIVRQLYEQLQLAIRHAILPPWYYMFELFDDTRFRRAGQYLRRDETKGGIFRLLRRPTKRRKLNNKAKFSDCCQQHAIRTPDYLEARSGHIRRPDNQKAQSLPHADLFAKPSRGKGGRGVESWRFDGSGWSRDGAPPLDEMALLDHFRALSMVEQYLIQRRLVPHPDLAELSADVLTTIRMMTILDENGDYEVTHAVYRMPNQPDAKVDNFHAGGLAAKVGIETGELGPASDIGLHPNSSWHAHHPISGARIAGRKLPFWNETLDLARRAHAAMPERTVIGWDIAIVEDGPVMIEGNGGADLDIIQRAYREPMGDSRFGELLAHHIETFERGAWPTNSV
ncbi:MAG: hypothetical protein JRG90_20575 [Deltaproteobacteria bacterium]|nr:hypothetical protein [Deltaproteobacteria bacterium]